MLDARRDHADRSPHLGAPFVEVDRVRLVEVLRQAPVDLRLGDRLDAHVRRVRAARGPISTWCSTVAISGGVGPSGVTPEPLPVFGDSQSRAMAAAAEPGPVGTGDGEGSGERTGAADGTVPNVTVHATAVSARHDHPPPPADRRTFTVGEERTGRRRPRRSPRRTGRWRPRATGSTRASPSPTRPTRPRRRPSRTNATT